MFDKRKGYKKPNYRENQVFESSKEAPKEGSTNLYLQIKAMKNLRASSISVAADPYQASLPASYNYPLQAKTNAKISPSYSGERNIDGGNVQQFVNGVTSKLLKAYDYIYFKPVLNYGYAPMGPAEITKYGAANYPGRELIDQRRNVFAETASVLLSTTYTTLDISDYFIETDMPMGSAEPVTIDGVLGYDTLSDVLYSTTTFYQLVLQAVHAMIKSFNSFRNKQGAMLRADFNRAVPMLNAYFSNMNKSAVDGWFKGICDSFTGEYFDNDFSKVVNHFVCVPSRRSNDLFNPMIEMGVEFAHPSKFKIHILNDARNKILATIDMMSTVSVTRTWFDDAEPSSKNIFQVCSALTDYLSAEATAKWARTNEFNSVTTTGRFNAFKFALDAITTIMTKFKPMCADIREALDILTRANIVKWVKGYVPVISKNFDQPNYDYLLVNDCLKNAFSGANKITFKNDTKRWRTWTLWNMYYGIPDYDAFSGGAFLTASFKDFEFELDDDNTIAYMPVLFATFDTDSYQLKGKMLNRSGNEVTLLKTEIDPAEYPTLNRLPVLESMTANKVRVPTVEFESTADDADISLVERTLLTVFGMGLVKQGDEYSLGLDPDILAEYLIEISDITNESISYARSQGIAIQGNATMPSTLGFSMSDKITQA